MDAERQWVPHNGKTGVLIVTNAEPSSVSTIRCGVAIADRQHVPVAILSVLRDLILDPEPAPGELENLTGARAETIRARVALRIAEATDMTRRIPIYVVRGPIGPAVASAAEIWGASLVVVGAGSSRVFGLPRHRHQLRQIVRHARRYVLAVSPTAPPEIGRTILTADFGGTSVEADERAFTLMSTGAPAELVHVVPSARVGDDARPRWTKVYLSAVNELFENTEVTLPHHHPPATRVLNGDAAQELIALARRDHVDLMALGRHVMPPGNHRTVGPILDAILDAAPCSMLIAPAPLAPVPTTSTEHGA